MVASAAPAGFAGTRVLFVGDLSPGRAALLDGLSAAGMRTHALASPERTGARLAWCDLLLFAPADRRAVAHFSRLGRGGKAMAAVLRPQEKALVPLSLKAGARSIFVDEVLPEEVCQFARGLGEEGLLRREVRWLRAEVRQGNGMRNFLGESAAATRLRRAVQRAGRKYPRLVLQGEKGSNFLLIAKALHLQHPGLRHPFLHWEAARMRPAALDRALARLEGFRGEEGDALRLGGTLFVEDAQMLAPRAQERLAGAVGQVGASEEFRLLLGHCLDPERLIQDELRPFLTRGDRGLTVRIPPLRERRKDIPALAASILDEFAERVGQGRRTLTPGALEWFSSQKWWGNEAELEVMLWRAFLVCEGSTISLDDLRPPGERARRGEMEAFFHERLSGVVAAVGEGEGAGSDFYAHTIRSVEKPLFELVLRESGGNQVTAARLLGMNRNTLRRKLRELGIAGGPQRRFPGRRR